MQCPNCGTSVPVYRNPAPTVDIIIETEGGIVLIERKNPPFGWAIPGGLTVAGSNGETVTLSRSLKSLSLVAYLWPK